MRKPNTDYRLWDIKTKTAVRTQKPGRLKFKGREIIMGLRFRKSIKLCKGLKLNLNKKSVGLSFGGKGAQVSLNSKGITTKTIGVPGTGLYYTSTSKVNSKKRNKPAKNGSGK